MTDLYLVRHAPASATDRLCGRAEGVPLSEEGVAGADRLARRFRDVLGAGGIAAVYSSPLERCLRTAGALAERFDLEVHTSEALGEVAFGAWTGRRFRDLEGEEAWSRFHQHRSGTRPPGGGELLAEVQARAVAEMLRLREAHRGRAAALVTHAGVIRAATAYFLGIAPDHILRLEVEPASVALLSLYPEDVRLRLWNAPGP